MNKRLLLSLYDRSGLGAYMPVDYKGHELAVEEHMKKFAELIVRECANACESHDIESFGILPIRAFMVTKSCQNNIKEHFGVKS